MHFLLEMLLRGAALSATILVLGVLPSARRVFAQGTLVTVSLLWLLGIPVMMAMGPRVDVALLPARAALPLATIPEAALLQLSQPVPPPPSQAPVAYPSAATGVGRSPERVAPVLIAFYLAVSAALLLASGVASLRAQAVVRRAHIAVPAHVARCVHVTAGQLGIRTPLRMCVSTEVAVPCVAGSLHPVIVFPADVGRWSAAGLHAVVLHEMGHVRRHDGLARVLCDVACAVHWVNPLVWRIARRLRAHAELACDGLVVQSGVDAESYARELVHLARTQRGVPGPRAAVGVTGASALRDRIEALLANNPVGGPRQIALAWLLAVTTGLSAALCVPVASAQQGGVAALNISDGGPEVSSNGAGLQARWNDHGRHQALFVTGVVDLGGAASGRLTGSGHLLLVEERRAGVHVFEWQAGGTEAIPDDVRRVLVQGGAQLARLTGGHRTGFPGATLTGLPAWSDDPTAHVIQAGWLSGSERVGLILRGGWRVQAGALEARDASAWFVLFGYDATTRHVRRVQISRDRDGRLNSAMFIDGVSAPYDEDARQWAVGAYSALLRNAPADIGLLPPSLP